MFNYIARREKVFAQLPPGSLAIVKGAKEITRSHDGHFDFRQNSNFYYLTGFTEPDAYLVLIKSMPDETGACQCKSVMYIEPYDERKAQWTGIMTRLEEVPEKYGVTEAKSVSVLNEDMPVFLSAAEHFHFTYPNAESEPLEKELNTQKDAWLASRTMDHSELVSHDLGALLVQMRMIKEDAEIEVLKKVAAISAQAHLSVMKSCQAGMREDQLAALIEFICKENGCEALAYPSIVAGGERGWCLHWRASGETIKNGELVLVDAAGELCGYASDITRTFPVNGKFTDEQKIIYNIVLSAQEAGIQCIKAGVAVKQIVETIQNTLLAGLKEHKIINVQVDDAAERDKQEKAQLQKLYPHGFGHFVGLDVHDVGNMRSKVRPMSLSERSLLTVEPGIYIAKDNLDVDARWRGIAVRIEDVAIVREDGAEVITSDVPKTIAEIEALMSTEMKSRGVLQMLGFAPVADVTADSLVHFSIFSKPVRKETEMPAQHSEIMAIS